MATKKLGLPPKKKKTSPLSDPKIKAFTQSGKGEKQTDTSEPTTSKKVGRTPHKKALEARSVRFAADDVSELEILAATWYAKSPNDARSKIGFAGIVRALMASAVPVLKQLDPQATEADLEETLKELFLNNLK